MDLLVAWVAFPALLLALAAGCGLLVDAARRRGACRSPLLPAVGFAAIVVVGQFLTLADATAELRRRRSPRWRSPGCALGCAAALGAPEPLGVGRRRGRVRRLRGADRALGRGRPSPATSGSTTPRPGWRSPTG